jgi:NADPH:quinone reductase-like Zn-dependent oxidoreductase
VKAKLNPRGFLMRAIVIQKFGGPENLVIKEIPDPEPKPGHVVIQVKAFGVNHAEMHMRRGEWAEAAEVSGIECSNPAPPANSRSGPR